MGAQDEVGANSRERLGWKRFLKLASEDEHQAREFAKSFLTEDARNVLAHKSMERDGGEKLLQEAVRAAEVRLPNGSMVRLPLVKGFEFADFGEYKWSLPCLDVQLKDVLPPWPLGDGFLGWNQAVDGPSLSPEERQIKTIQDFVVDFLNGKAQAHSFSKDEWTTQLMDACKFGIRDWEGLFNTCSEPKRGLSDFFLEKLLPYLIYESDNAKFILYDSHGLYKVISMAVSSSTMGRGSFDQFVRRLKAVNFVRPGFGEDIANTGAELETKVAQAFHEHRLASGK